MSTVKGRFTRRRVMATGLVMAVGLVGLGYVDYRLGLRSTGTNQTVRLISITSGERAPEVATQLDQAGLIRDRFSFLTYLYLHGLAQQIKAGSFGLAPSQSAEQIAAIITNAQAAQNRLVIPEGYRISQITALVAKHGISAADFTAALAEPHSQPFLATAGRPPGIGLEGYLFPDTYQIDSQTTASGLVNEMLNDFGSRVGPAYVQAFAAEGLTLNQGLTLASIVEREVSNPADRPIVAQVFLKRYHLGMPLGSDVTTQYASDKAGVPFDLNINSPYNTRKFAGLPPGPICNPGLNALDAVAHPAATDYLYFVTGSDGVTYYAKTLAEHNQNIAQHLKQ